MYRVIVWGTGEEYFAHLHHVRCCVARGEFELVGVTSTDGWYRMIDGFPFIAKTELMEVPHDYVLVAAANHIAEIKREYAALGGNAERILPIDVLDAAGLTFSQYVELYRSKISILANNCWGGLTYHILHMKFRTPLINMWETEEDFIAMLQDFPQRIQRPLEFVRIEHREPPLRDYPVFRLPASAGGGRFSI